MITSIGQMSILNDFLNLEFMQFDKGKKPNEYINVNPPYNETLTLKSLIKS